MSPYFGRYPSPIGANGDQMPERVSERDSGDRMMLRDMRSVFLEAGPDGLADPVRKPTRADIPNEMCWHLSGRALQYRSRDIRRDALIDNLAATAEMRGASIGCLDGAVLADPANALRFPSRGGQDCVP